MRLTKLLVGAALGLGLGACGGGADRADVASVGATTSTEASLTAIPTTTTAAPAATAPSTTTTTTTTPPRPNGTTGSIRSTVAVTTTRGLASAPLPPSTTFAPDRPPCSPGRLSVEVTTDKAIYRPGERVKVLATLRNLSGAPCFYTNYVGEQRFETAAGSPIRPGSMFIADALKNSSLAPGATLTQSPTWDQQACIANPFPQCAPAPPGTYVVKIGWRFGGDPSEGSATFRLVAA